jgi:hypothetical protein
MTPSAGWTRLGTAPSSTVHTLRKAVDQDLARLASATESNWDEVKGSVNGAVYSLQEEVRRLRPDAKPMGGTGPS